MRIDPALASLCEATSRAVGVWENETGIVGCPLCGKSADEHPEIHGLGDEPFRLSDSKEGGMASRWHRPWRFVMPRWFKCWRVTRHRERTFVAQGYRWTECYCGLRCFGTAAPAALSDSKEEE